MWWRRLDKSERLEHSEKVTQVGNEIRNVVVQEAK